MLAVFSLKLVYSIMCGKSFEIHGVHIPRKCFKSTVTHKISETNSSFHVK